MHSTYYQILGVSLTASLAEIRRRYRELARTHHPDVSGDRSAGHQEFLVISEAYQVLSDPLRRAEYDRGLASAAATVEGQGSRVKGQGSRVEGRFDPRPSTLDPRVAAIPVFGAGTRVEVDFGGVVLECRVREYQGRRLHLATPPGARRSPQFREGVPVRLTLYQSGVCLETETRTREWIWMQPPVVVVGPLDRWQEKRRRSAVRARRELAARLVLETTPPAAPGVITLVGRSLDVSASGVLLLVAAGGGPGGGHRPQGGPSPSAHGAVGQGLAGRLTMNAGDEIWCEDLPVRVVRVRHWLRSSGRALEIAVQLESADAAERQRWQDCVARLGSEE
jgi:hypothetical protein